MSFILDALKKVERKTDENAQNAVVMQGGRRWGDRRFPWALGAVVLLAISALALATVSFLRSFPSGSVEPESERPAVSISEPSASPTSPPSREVPPPKRSERAETVAPSATVEDEGPAVIAESEEPQAAPPITLVGRSADGPGAAALSTTGDGQPPGELPPLVLQGTSMIDGRPVAVVNYQRVFEGDFIEGARVVKILDRAVELEFQGTQFTIRL